MANRFMRFKTTEGDDVFIAPDAVAAVQPTELPVPPREGVCWLRLWGGAIVPVACFATDAAALIECALADCEAEFDDEGE